MCRRVEEEGGMAQRYLVPHFSIVNSAGFSNTAVSNHTARGDAIADQRDFMWPLATACGAAELPATTGALLIPHHNL
jgi:hypothetical protein